jgi:hypothetical protein
MNIMLSDITGDIGAQRGGKQEMTGKSRPVSRGDFGRREGRNYNL